MAEVCFTVLGRLAVAVGGTEVEFAMFGSNECFGSVDYFLARGLAGLGDRDGAAAAYRRAIVRNRAAGVLPWLRRSQAQLAELDPTPASLPAGAGVTTALRGNARG